MSELNVVLDFIAKKKAESTFIQLKEGESQRVTLKKLEAITKNGFNGKPKDVLLLTCLVDTVLGPREKTFDNGSQKFSQELIDKKIVIGATFTITRTGSGPNTKYPISDVVLPGGAPGVAQTPPTPSAPSTPKA